MEESRDFVELLAKHGIQDFSIGVVYDLEEAFYVRRIFPKNGNLDVLFKNNIASLERIAQRCLYRYLDMEEERIRYREVVGTYHVSFKAEYKKNAPENIGLMDFCRVAHKI